MITKKILELAVKLLSMYKQSKNLVKKVRKMCMDSTNSNVNKINGTMKRYMERTSSELQNLDFAMSQRVKHYCLDVIYGPRAKEKEDGKISKVV
jgi:hypothetical protein